VLGLSLSLGCTQTFGGARGDGARPGVEAADLALARGNFEQAIQVFDELLRRDPGDRRALLGSARANLAADRGEAALGRFASYREQGNPWRQVEQWEYCSALALGTQQVLASGGRPDWALELAYRLESEECGHAGTTDLISRSAISLAKQEVAQGRGDHALEVYLSLLPPEGEPLGPSIHTNALAGAFLGAAELLIEAGRREEALALLSQGLDAFPSDADLVHRMVTVLADGSAAVIPRVSSPGVTQPAAPR
jgi:tetratricopeptide (TPR) repeat protein